MSKCVWYLGCVERTNVVVTEGPCRELVQKFMLAQDSANLGRVVTKSQLGKLWQEDREFETSLC